MKDVYSVATLNQYIKHLFASDYNLNNIMVSGEVSNCKYHTSGHIYFTLKDKSAAIACVMFAGNRTTGLKFRLGEGMQVIAFGSSAFMSVTVNISFTCAKLNRMVLDFYIKSMKN